MASADTLVTLGMTEIGKPYIYGDEGPNSFDCSGLMMYLFAKVGIILPRTAKEQQQAATPVTTPKIGDLVFWGSPATHVALYIGGGQVLHAPTSGDHVKISTIWGTPTYGRVSGITQGVVTTTVSATSSAASSVLGWLGIDVDELQQRVRSAGITLLAAAAGATLIGVGVWRVAKS